VEAGNWLVHCHVAYHTSMLLSAKPVPLPKDPVVIDPMHGMRGMVLAVTVRPGKSVTHRPAASAGARELRLIAQAAPKRFANVLDEMAFVEQTGATPPAMDSVPVPSSPLILKRNEPVRITIVNHTRAPTGVHWHGIEVPAYSDGVPSWSGSGNQLAPVIAPGDSFVAAFTPTRSGTFIYHAHANESIQISLGLYGALLVVDDPATYDPTRERLIVLGSAGPLEQGARINGRVKPDTMRLEVGTTYRLRVIHIVPDWTIRLALLRGDSVVHWKALAKDGAELPPSMQTERPAALIAGPGETMDFAYTPTAPGLLRLDVQQRTGLWKTQLPIRVVGARTIAKAH
jgi:FtsP/CotA-like multicopper oxidase with cupredoxin domain